MPPLAPDGHEAAPDSIVYRRPSARLALPPARRRGRNEAIPSPAETRIVRIASLPEWRELQDERRTPANARVKGREAPARSAFPGRLLYGAIPDFAVSPRRD